MGFLKISHPAGGHRDQDSKIQFTG